MKKTILLGVLSLIFASVSFAQVQVGITAGLSGSSFIESGEDAQDFNYLVGFQGGLVVDFNLTPKFSVIPELLFSQRGAYQKFEEADNSKNTIKYFCTINYVQLPVNVAYKFNPKWFIFAGPYVGYAISGSQKQETNINGEKETETEDIEFGSGISQMNPLDYGVNFGAGMNFGKGFIKLQYNLGLGNLYNHSSATLKNTNGAITVGYFF